MLGWLIEIEFTRPYKTNKAGEEPGEPKKYQAFGLLLKEDDEAYYLSQVLSPEGDNEVVTKVLKNPSTRVKQHAKLRDVQEQ